jgi:catechol 2,3-dioxygenase-like lactoylglutathione lyase family enzyme
LILAALPPPPMPGSVQHASLRRVVLGSCAPGRAAAWYRRALGLAGTRRADPDTSSNAGDEALQAGDVEVLITDRSRVAASAVEPNRLVLNFVVDDILEIEARLVAMEAIWVRELERTPWGIIGTVLDPDGNLVQIIEPAGGTLPWQAEDKEEHP